MWRTSETKENRKIFHVASTKKQNSRNKLEGLLLSKYPINQQGVCELFSAKAKLHHECHCCLQILLLQNVLELSQKTHVLQLQWVNLDTTHQY